MNRIVATIAVSMALLGAPAGAHAATTSSGPGPTRVLIVGDSVTQGRAGDYTWRYRFWNTLRANHLAVDFVGPRTTLSNDSTDYADPHFDQDHAARWGAAMITGGWWVAGFPADNTQDIVSAYRPDVVVNDLGFNNLHPYGGADADPATVIALARGFVADVRAQNPNVTIIFGELPQTWATGGIATYNGMLVDMAASLDQPTARVIVAAVRSDFTQADTYDGVHPNASGEVKIARQFSAVLLGLGLPTDSVATVPATFSGSAHLAAAAARHRSARLRFTTPTGATKQAVWKRDVSVRGHWHLVTYVGSTAHRLRVTDLRHHHRYAFRMRAYRGALLSTAYSNRVRVRIS